MLYRDVKKKIAALIFSFLCWHGVSAQVDSSEYYARLITGNTVKDWYTRPAIVDNPSDLKYSVLHFEWSAKKGTYTMGGRGRDMAGKYRAFTWMIQKQPGQYVLVISAKERYRISVQESDPVILF